MSHERTVRDAAEPARQEPPSRDLLQVVLCGERPMAGGLTVELGPADVVVIGRGPALAVEARPGDREVWLRVPDPRVSERHAVVERRGAQLVVEDLGSMNGTFVNGEPCQRSPLQEGHTLAVGRTVLTAAFGVRGAIVGKPARVAGAPALETFSPALAHVHAVLAQAARSEVPVVLGGETGTGKEITARALHTLSGRSGRFVAVNCGALPEALVESELFGHRKGAFSGAVQDKVGLVAAARGGTLLLDEVGELPPAAQVKLLRVLQEREVLPLGAAEPQKVDFRLVSATHQDLAALVSRGRFRADLYARLRGLEVELPPLRERRADLGLLTAALLRAHAGDDATAVRLDRRCAEALLTHDWPLNVRELEQVLRALLALAGPNRLLTHEALQATPFARPAPAARRPDDPEALRAELLSQLAEHQGNISAVARAMRRTRMQIHRWLKRWTIDLEGFRRR